MNQTLSSRAEQDRGCAEVLRWRFERLVEAGYDARTASSLAGRLEIDLHFAVALLDRGCPPETAVRILV